MKNVLVFGGTTEGRLIAEFLASKNISVDLHVATEYGSTVVQEMENLNVHVGRLDCSQIKKLFTICGYCLVIDATHPFAVEVSRNIASAVPKGIKIIRFRRKTQTLAGEQNEKIRVFSSINDCIVELKKTSGNILLTTGSKDLGEFCSHAELLPRLNARVIPSVESLNICTHSGLEGARIFAMQGPFSREFNCAQIRERKIQVLVTKQSGRTGGVDEKLLACQDCGITCFVIRDPVVQVTDDVTGNENYAVACDYASLMKEVGNATGVDAAACNVEYVLAGIGPGGEGQVTAEVRNAVSRADVIFGAGRMIESVGGFCALGVKRIEEYTAEKILPWVEEIRKDFIGTLKVVVLFSGDTGFYSGAGKLCRKLKNDFGAKVRVLAGISSMSYAASLFAMDWQDCTIISLHGVAEDMWRHQLAAAAEARNKIFFITGGSSDIPKIMDVLLQSAAAPASSCRYKMLLGYNLSYPDEKTYELHAGDFLPEFSPGLYCGFLMPE